MAPYQQIVRGDIIPHVLSFLDTAYSSPFQFNAVWLINNSLSQLQ